MLAAGGSDSYLTASRKAAGPSLVTLIEHGHHVAELELNRLSVTWTSFQDCIGGIAFSRSLGGDAYKIVWTGTCWRTESIRIPLAATGVCGSADSQTYYLIADGSAFTLAGDNLSEVYSALERVTECYLTSTGFVLGARHLNSRTGHHFELEYHDRISTDPLWRTPLTGQIIIASSPHSRQFYLMGTGPVQVFTDRGAGETLDSSIAGIGLTRSGHHVYLDHDGRLI